MFSNFFINRPIFASVVSILVVIAGLVSYRTLPIAQYPEVTPPVVHIDARYPGANAQVLADTVAATIEQEVNGVENMLYMNSTSASDGSYGLDITFELGTDIDQATVLVQNRVNSAQPRLPEEVQRQGVTVRKQSTNIVQVITLYAPDGRYDDLFIANWVTLNLRDPMSRINGVGSLRIIPDKDYGMRVWIDPQQLKARNLTTNDVVAALREQNVQVAAGQLGQAPAPTGQNFQYIVTTLGRLTSEDQFRAIVVKADGQRVVKLSDVARVELGARNYDTTARFSDKPAAVMIVYQSPGANAVSVAENIRKTLDTFKAGNQWPPGLQTAVIYDIAAFVQGSIDEVYTTLFEAVGLVVLVVLVFLQSWRATLIPLITIPVSLIGTFAVIKLFGFSINLLTLFALVLAIGIVVDDAIVVVENVERNMAEHHLQPKQATIRAMAEVFSPIIAISLVLMSVFGPTAALPGITGALYRQFALTIAASTLFSAINALTLSPALTALLLKPHVKGQKPNIFTRAFDSVFNPITHAYRSIITVSLRFAPVTFILFIGVIFATGWTYLSVPTGFVPSEDLGFFVTNLQLPDASSQERTQKVLNDVATNIRSTKGVKATLALGGFSVINGNGPNNATLFTQLQPFDERTKNDLDITKITGEVGGALHMRQDSFGFTFQFPPIPGLGSTLGFDMRIQDRANLGGGVLGANAFAMMAAGGSQPQLIGQSVRSTFAPGVPQIYADIDREKVKKLGIPLQSVFDTLQSALGSTYVNDFNKFGRTYQVNVQAEPQFRATSEDIRKLEVRSNTGNMVPLGSFVKIRDSFGPDRITRYNLFPSAQIIGEPAVGTSSGQALSIMEGIAEKQLPPGLAYEWTGISKQEKDTGNQAAIVFGLAILVVYLILAAQYESWSTPLAVAMSIPLAVIGAMGFLVIRGMDNNLFTQIGLVLLVGLAAKNAILIVEFARTSRAAGKGIVESAVEAATLRFRPILMTSFAFILGVLPLVIATGPGANSRRALGSAVFGGMIGATILGLFFIPLLYVVVQGITEKITGRKPVPALPVPAEPVNEH